MQVSRQVLRAIVYSRGSSANATLRVFVCLEEDEDERQAVHLSLLAAPLLMKQRHLLLWFPLMSAI